MAPCVCLYPLMLTWRYFADGGRMPAIALVAVGTLDKDGTVTETLCKHLSPNVIQPHTPSWKRKREEKFSLSSQLTCWLCASVNIKRQIRSELMWSLWNKMRHLCVCVWALLPSCGWRWTASPDRSVQSWRGLWIRRLWGTAGRHGRSLPHVGSARNRRSSTRRQTRSTSQVVSLFEQRVEVRWRGIIEKNKLQLGPCKKNYEVHVNR